MLDILYFCQETSNVWQFVGRVLLVFKIVIPILLIIFGMIDLGKAVVASDDKAIKSATSSLVKRAIAGVVIFFIPTIVGAIFNLVGNFQRAEIKDDYKICNDCITYPNSKCTVEE